MGLGKRQIKAKIGRPSEATRGQGSRWEAFLIEAVATSYKYPERMTTDRFRTRDMYRTG